MTHLLCILLTQLSWRCVNFATLTMLATNSLLMSSIIGSFAAAIACEKNGNVPVTLEELLKKLIIWDGFQ